MHQNIKNFAIAAAKETENVRHIGIFTGHGIRFCNVAIVILIPAPVNYYFLMFAVDVAEAVKLDK